VRTILIFFVFFNTAFSKNLNVGIVLDKSLEESQFILNQINKNLQIVIENPKAVTISPENILAGNGDIPTIKENFDKIMDVKNLNLILTIGPISSVVSAEKEKLAKPVISTHLFDRTKANKKNMAALELYPTLKEVKEHLQEIKAGKNILVVCQEAPVMDGFLEQIKVALDEEFSLNFFKTAGVVDPEKLNGMDLVFYLPEPFRDPLNFSAFQKLVNEKGIISYSISGTEDFQYGVFIAPEITNFNERLARVLALSMMELQQGKSIEKLEKKFLSFKKITANKEVAKNFGFKALNLAYSTPGTGTPAINLVELSLKDAVTKAMNLNLNYQTTQFAFQQSEYTAKSAFTKFFPQIGFEASSDLYKDPDGLLLTRTDQEVNRLNFVARQFVFSDNTLANYNISTYLRDKTGYRSEEVKIDVIASTIIKYLETLNLASIVKIREENLALTMENLQIAELNFKTGRSAKFEVFRWESQVSQYKKELADSNFAFKTSLHELNRLMNNNDLSKEYSMQDYEILKDLLVDEDVHLPSKYTDLQSLEKYISFVIEESKEGYPLLKQVEQDVKIAERLLLNKDRAFFLPNVELFSDYTLIAGDNPYAESGIPDNDMRVGIRLTFPLFESLNKFQERSAEVRRLSVAQTAKSDVYQQVEKLIRDQIVGVRTAFVQIKYETDRETAAKSNLDLIRLSYKTGKIDILFLLDAQNFYLRAREGVIIAKNNFLLELARLEMRMGSFSFLKTSNELNEFHEKYRKYMGIKAI
jgi:outer membrane protein